MKGRSVLGAVGKNIRARLGAGLLIAIPLAFTYIIVRYVLVFLDELLYPTVLSNSIGWDFPGLGVVVMLLLLYLLGELAASNLGSRFLNPVLALAEHIPVVRTIYLASKEATKLFHSDQHEYRRVVLVEFPRPGVLAVGLVTASFLNTYGQPMVAVYIPTTPNPTSGQLAIVPAGEARDAGISVEVALRMIISGGILSPQVVGTELERSDRGGVKP